MRQPRPRPDEADRPRPRYFTRQVPLSADFTQGELSALDRFRRHNRLIHGWGVAGGLKPEPVLDLKPDELRKKYGVDPTGVDPKRGRWAVVLPGYALTPYGDEVVLTRPVFVNLSHERPDGTLVITPASCHPATAEKTKGRKGTFALVVEAWEDHTGAVRTTTTRCGDHPDQYDFARTEDLVVFKLVPIEEFKKVENGEPYPKEDPKHKGVSRETRILLGLPARHSVRIGTVDFGQTPPVDASDADAKPTPLSF